MKTLNTIIAHKRKETAERKSLYPTALLERSEYFRTPTVSLKKYLTRPDKTGVIAEFKRQSPSKGPIAPYADPEWITVGYMQGGAAALSVLTDTTYFGGKNADLTTARRFNFCPILRKDFVVEEYQLVEARSIGADVVLLIAAVLTTQEIKHLTQFAQDLGLEVLTEIHSQAELDKVSPHSDLIGVNNRNLHTMEVSIQTSAALAAQLPTTMVRISESGISSPEDAAQLRQWGYQGFLIGESFMRQPAPEVACAKFIHDLEGLLRQERAI